MNGFLALALMLLMVLVVLGVSVLILRRNRRKENTEFDERQLQAQGQASSLAVAVGMLYFMALYLFLPDQISGETMRSVLLLGLVLAALMGVTYAILSDAYVGRSDTLENKGLGALLLGIIYLVFFVLRMVLVSDVLPLANESAWRSLVLGVGLAYVGILLLIKDRRSRKEDADGEE